MPSTQNERDPVPRGRDFESPCDIPPGLQFLQASWRNQTFGEKLGKRITVYLSFLGRNTEGLVSRSPRISLIEHVTEGAFAKYIFPIIHIRRLGDDLQLRQIPQVFSNVNDINIFSHCFLVNQAQKVGNIPVAVKKEKICTKYSL